MVIFRIIFNLFRLITRLLFSIFWLPFYIITRNLYVLLLVGAALVIYLYMSSDDQATRAPTNVNPPRLVRNTNGDKVQVASPVTRIENGDSAFANDLYAQMTPEEKAYYSQFFYWAMNTLPDGQTHSWSNIDIGGAIEPTQSFTNKSGEQCRRFSETLKVHTVQQQITGIACRESDGVHWCKLGPTATPACGLGHTPGMLEGITGSFKKLF